MRHAIFRTLALAGILFFLLPPAGQAEVRKIEIDVAGYLCGL
jgi:hypothetical protein